ncbi:MAG: hypothetical protein ABJD02_12435 [Paraglaciecola sp.]|uniref:hypothetical protein n=1 Tax=Paraglaciecola sp. TaxID=1920173 RepID=UPI003264C572
MEIRRPLWLKAMIALTSFVVLTTILLASSGETTLLVSGIRFAIFTVLLIGLVLNSSFARWASVILYTMVVFGGIGSLIVTFQNGNLSIYKGMLVILLICPILSICYACAVSRSVRKYYQAIGEKSVSNEHQT